MNAPRVVIVGAGAAGLIAAGRLRGSWDVVVVDKGRGVGGRMATRRIGDATFDHGAQFITAHTPEFAAVVAGWEAAGVVRRWYRGRVGPDGVDDADGHVRFRGVATMNDVARHLAGDLDIRRGTRVTALERAAAGWILHLDDGNTLDADAVLLTAPVPQSLELLAAGDVELASEDRDALGDVRYDPCIAVLATLRGASGLHEPGAVDPDGGPIDWMADNHMKGVSSASAVTIHADAEFSTAHWESTDELVITELLRAAALDAEPIEQAVQVQRWRYARPAVLHSQRCLVASGLPTLIWAGDAFGGAKVEGAVLSGIAASEALVRR